MSDFKLDWNGAEVAAEVQAESLAACIEGAKVIAIDAKARVSVDSGDLRATITVKSWKRSDAVGAYVTAGGESLGHVARFVELGTPGTVFKAGKKKGKERKSIKAKPYLRPALKKNKARIRRKFKERLKK